MQGVDLSVCSAETLVIGLGDNRSVPNDYRANQGIGLDLAAAPGGQAQGQVHKFFVVCNHIRDIQIFIRMSGDGRCYGLF